MKTSRFTIDVPDFPERGRHLVFNTLTRAQVVVDDELKAALRSLPAPPANPLVASAISQLARMGIVVPSDQEDITGLERWFASIRDDASVLRPVVLLTYACNFSCVYCIEEGLRQTSSMDEAGARACVSYIERKLNELGSKSISLTFYGGEPLLNLAAVRTVARGLHDLSVRRNVPVAFGFSTNGSLFTREIVDELKPLGLRGAKITLDGPREVHDRNRPLRAGGGTFDLLVRNLQEVIDHTAIDLEINFDDTNVERVPELMDLLAGMGLAAKFRKLVLSPITPTPHQREGSLPTQEIPCSFVSLKGSEQMVALTRAAMERGFPIHPEVVAQGCDLTMRRTGFFVDPRGRLWHCGGFAGTDEFSAGTIQAPEEERFHGLQLWRRCMDCPYVPLCGDGCPFGSYIRFGDPLRLHCSKEAVAYRVSETLKLAYRQKNQKRAP